MSWEQVVVWTTFFGLQAWIAYIQLKLATQQKMNHELMNSRLDQLVKSKEQASHAAGMAEANEQARVRAVDLLAKGITDAKTDAIEKIIENHGNGPDERLAEIRGQS
jgi:hypothetical protein